MHVVWDELRVEKGQLICSDDTSSGLSGIRYLNDLDMHLSKRFLYLADLKAITRMTSADQDISVIVLGSIDETIIKERKWSAIIIPDGGRINDIFQQVQEIFEKFEHWEKEILEAIAEDKGLQTIFDLGARFLENPIALFDPSQILLMVAGNLPADIHNTIWEDVLTEGYSRIENFTVEEQHILEERLNEDVGPFIYQSKGRFRDHQFITASLNDEGVVLGTFGLIDIIAPFTLGQLSIVSYLKSFMELALKVDMRHAGFSNGTDYFVERLLQGFPIKEKAVTFHLAKRNWKLDDNYCLFYFVRTNNSTSEHSLDEKYVFRIKNYFDDANIFPYENGILAIGHQNDLIRMDPLFKKGLSQLLNSIDLRCGVSLLFHDFMHLKFAFIQCKTALITDEDVGKSTINLFEARYSKHIIDALDVSTSVKSLCHPGVFKLTRVDSGKGQDFVQTLRVYLIHGRNKTTTANKLFIHRNTLIYRLGRIEDILGVVLDDADDQILFILLMSTLILEQITSPPDLRTK